MWQQTVISLLVIPLTVSVGVIINKLTVKRTAIFCAGISGAAVYIVGLTALAGPAVLSLNLLTLVLMCIFGSVSSITGIYLASIFRILQYAIMKSSTKPSDSLSNAYAE